MEKSQATVARLDGARGMVPWRAKVGEEVTATDYEKKERMLSVEQTDREVVWTLSVPLDEPDLVYAPPESA